MSLDTEWVFDNIHHRFMFKILRMKGNIFQHNKGNKKRTHSQHTINIQNVSSKIGNMTKMITLPLPVQYSTRSHFPPFLSLLLLLKKNTNPNSLSLPSSQSSPSPSTNPLSTPLTLRECQGPLYYI